MLLQGRGGWALHVVGWQLPLNGCHWHQRPPAATGCMAGGTAGERLCPGRTLGGAPASERVLQPAATAEPAGWQAVCRPCVHPLYIRVWFCSQAAARPPAPHSASTVVHVRPRSSRTAARRVGIIMVCPPAPVACSWWAVTPRRTWRVGGEVAGSVGGACYVRLARAPRGPEHARRAPVLGGNQAPGQPGRALRPARSLCGRPGTHFVRQPGANPCQPTRGPSTCARPAPAAAGSRRRQRVPGATQRASAPASSGLATDGVF